MNGSPTDTCVQATGSGDCLAAATPILAATVGAPGKYGS
jgi:hypothetical protein